jgi:hypothetical protein
MVARRPRLAIEFHEVTRALFLVLSLLIALIGGTASARMMLNAWPQIGAEHSGAWRLHEATGAKDMDPYFAAIQQTRLQPPSGQTEGRVYSAGTDETGTPLTTACTYELQGRAPVARLFTLRAETPEGRLIAPSEPLPMALHSDAMIFKGNNFAIAASAQAKAGNWLPLGARNAGAVPFRFVLAIYDISVSDGDFGGELVLPTVTRKACG